MDRKATFADAIKVQEGHVQSAERLVDGQKDIIRKFANEALANFAEVNFLYELENALAMHRVRLGRFRRDDALFRGA
jgi:hypothetical protein